MIPPFGFFPQFTDSLQFCRTQNKREREEMQIRRRRDEARAAKALRAQPTGNSITTNLIDARLEKLRAEGTPRIKRPKRHAAPPVSPDPDTSEFPDFTFTGDSGDMDYGSLAQRMMNDIFATSGIQGGTPSEPTESRSDSPSFENASIPDGASTPSSENSDSFEDFPTLSFFSPTKLSSLTSPNRNRLWENGSPDKGKELPEVKEEDEDGEEDEDDEIQAEDDGDDVFNEGDTTIGPRENP